MFKTDLSYIDKYELPSVCYTVLQRCECADMLMASKLRLMNELREIIVSMNIDEVSSVYLEPDRATGVR